MAEAGALIWKAGEVPIDAARLTLLHATHGSGLRRFVLGVVRDRGVAEDIVQATFAKAVEAASDVPPEAMKSWLYRVAFHEAVTWKRRFNINRRAIRELADGHAQLGSESPEQPLVRREIVDQVREAMQSLPTNQRRVLQARVYEEKTFAQIAAEMRLPLGTVLTHMRRALEQLRRKLTRND